LRLDLRAGFDVVIERFEIERPRPDRGRANFSRQSNTPATKQDLCLHSFIALQSKNNPFLIESVKVVFHPESLAPRRVSP
jgi:hypothetical protein